MDWLKDKKNQPIVIGIAVGLIVVIGVCVWFFALRPSGGAATPGGTTPPTANAGSEPSAPPANGGTSAGAPAAGSAPAPGGAAAPVATPPAAGTTAPAGASAPAGGAAPTGAAAPAAASGTKTASVVPMETWRSDPFQPIGYKAVKKGPQPKPHIVDFPFERLPVKVTWDKNGRSRAKLKPEIQQPARRMAGILLNERVYAILESGGVSQVVKPGDYTTDRLATVERIESDRVILKTVDAKPRYIVVKMAGSPTAEAANSMQTPNAALMSAPMPNRTRVAAPPSIP